VIESNQVSLNRIYLYDLRKNIPSSFFSKFQIKFELGQKIFLEYQLVKLSDQKMIKRAQQGYAAKKFN